MHDDTRLAHRNDNQLADTDAHAEYEREVIRDLSRAGTAWLVFRRPGETNFYASMQHAERSSDGDYTSRTDLTIKTS